MAEVHAGSGYLSQSAPGIYFGGQITKVTVRWPDGTSSVDTIQDGANTLVIKQP